MSLIRPLKLPKPNELVLGSPVAHLDFGSFRLDLDRNLLLREGEKVPLSYKAFLLLKVLAEANGRPLSKQQLMDAVWPGLIIEENNLSVQVAGLRKILGASPGGGPWILTIPRVGYRLFSASTESLAPSTVLVDRPSILVLPFANVSGDPTQNYVADGITEDVIIAMSRYRWFTVIPRSASFLIGREMLDASAALPEHKISHVVEGTLRKDGSRIRITARLNERQTGRQIWGERFDLELGDVFAVQDEIAERIAGAVEPELLQVPPPVLRHTGNITAWDLVRQGTFRFHQLRRETHLEARALFRRAAALDSQLPEAHLWIARVNAGLVAYGWTDQVSQDIAEGRAAGRRAIELDERNPYAHYGLAIVSAYGGYFDEAIRAGEHAIETAPSFALGHLVLGMSQLFSGNAQAAVGPLEHGLRLSPHDPQNFVWHTLLALSHLFTQSPRLAHENASKALKIRPGWKTALEVLVACSVALGDYEQAEVRRHEFLAAAPVSGDVLAPLRANNSAGAAQLLTAANDQRGSSTSSA